MSKYTQHGWSVDGFNLAAVITSAKPYVTIARCEGGNENKITIQEAIEHARLIAQAPAMADMLKRLYPLLDWQQFPEEKEEIKSLITKATQP